MCEFTGYCEKDPTKLVNNVIYGFKDQYDKAVSKAQSVVEKQRLLKNKK